MGWFSSRNHSSHESIDDFEVPVMNRVENDTKMIRKHLQVANALLMVTSLLNVVILFKR